MKRVEIALLSISMLALAACGGSTDDTSDSEGPLTLYQIVPIESQVTSLPFMKTSAQAAIDEINASGGVGGRQVKLVTCNDKFDANEALRCAQKAVQDKAVAVVGSLTGFGAQVMPVLEKGGIANISPVAVTEADATNPNVFLTDPGVPGFAAFPALAEKYLGATSVVAVDTDTSNTAVNQKYYELGSKLSGVPIADKIVIPNDAVDYAPYVAQAEKSGAGAIITSVAADDQLKLWKALAGADSTLKVVMSSGTVTADLLKEAGSAANGSYTASGLPNIEDANPTGKAYLAAMKKYQPQEKVVGGVGMSAWVSVKLWAQVADKIEGPITSKSTLDAMNNVHNEKFMWIDSLSFDVPGAVKDLPRVASTTMFPLKIENAALIAEEPFDPFS